MEEIADAANDFAAAFEASFARFQVCVEEACGGSSDWPSRTAAAIQAGFEFAADNPAAASVLTREALATARDGAARYQRLVAYVAAGLAPGRAHQGDDRVLPEVTERAVAGGLLALVNERLERGMPAELPALAPQAIQFALTPYVGAAESRRIAAAA